MSSAADLTWFARHEIRLAWREWLAMMTGARKKRTRAVIGLLLLAAILHLPAYAVIGRFADLQAPLDKLVPGRLTEGGVIVVESSTRSPLRLALPLELERRYGDTTLAVYSGPAAPGREAEEVAGS